LIEKGGDLTVKDEQNWTPVDYASVGPEGAHFSALEISPVKVKEGKNISWKYLRIFLESKEEEEEEESEEEERPKKKGKKTTAKKPRRSARCVLTFFLFLTSQEIDPPMKKKKKKISNQAKVLKKEKK
jgi:hypothetical protein